MRETIIKLLEHKYGSVRRGRRRVGLEWLEQALIGTYMFKADYVDQGGLTSFETAVASLVAEGYLTPLAKRSVYKTTKVDAVYWLPSNSSSVPLWSDAEMLRMMDQEMLRFDYYNNHPGEQTAENWLYITRVYEFLRTAEQREWVTREERSLELFGREKWLAGSEGRAFLSRLGLTLDSIKAEHTSEPFIFYRVPETPVYSILIVENLSIYHSARRLLGQGLPICGYRPEMLIYGEGWKIVRSLAHLEELCLGAGIDILYAGDMDKTGYDIYGKLKLSYSGLNLLLALSLYEEMMKYPEHAYPYDDHKQQDCSPKHLEIVYGEFSVNADLTAYVKRLLEEGRRIPQEVLNYEVMARLAKA